MSDVILRVFFMGMVAFAPNDACYEVGNLDCSVTVLLPDAFHGFPADYIHRHYPKVSWNVVAEATADQVEPTYEHGYWSLRGEEITFEWILGETSSPAEEGKSLRALEVFGAAEETLGSQATTAVATEFPDESMPVDDFRWVVSREEIFGSPAPHFLSSCVGPSETVEDCPILGRVRLKRGKLKTCEPVALGGKYPAISFFPATSPIHRALAESVMLEDRVSAADFGGAPVKGVKVISHSFFDNRKDFVELKDDACPEEEHRCIDVVISNLPPARGRSTVGFHFTRYYDLMRENLTEGQEIGLMQTTVERLANAPVSDRPFPIVDQASQIQMMQSVCDRWRRIRVRFPHLSSGVNRPICPPIR